MVYQKENFVRVNSRVEVKHHSFIKAEAKRLKVTEGEALRVIIDFYMDNKK